MAVQGEQKLLWDNPNFAKIPSSVEAITGVYGKHMLKQAAMDKTIENKPFVVFDNACGTGIVTEELHKLLSKRSSDTYEVTCGDLADAMVESATARVYNHGWSNTTVRKVDAQDTHLPDAHFTHVFTNFGIMLMPKPDEALSECFRILQPGGICAFTTWQQVGWYEDIKTAITSIPGLPDIPLASAEMLKGYGVGDWDDAEFIQRTMTQHKFTNVNVQVIPNTSIAQTPEEIRSVVRACVTILARKYWTKDEQEQFENEALFDGVGQWLSNKYAGKPIEWHWVGLVTTATRSAP